MMTSKESSDLESINLEDRKKQSKLRDDFSTVHSPYNLVGVSPSWPVRRGIRSFVITTR